MPYINKLDRAKIESGWLPSNAGELNYSIHLLLEKYLGTMGESYQTYNDMMGALMGVQAELYRRKIAPYEDKKVKENGDIAFYQEK